MSGINLGPWELLLFLVFFLSFPLQMTFPYQKKPTIYTLFVSYWFLFFSPHIICGPINIYVKVLCVLFKDGLLYWFQMICNVFTFQCIHFQFYSWLPIFVQKTARSGLHILLGGICALTVVVFFRFVSTFLLSSSTPAYPHAYLQPIYLNLVYLCLVKIIFFFKYNVECYCLRLDYTSSIAYASPNCYCHIILGIEYSFSEYQIFICAIR